MLRSRRRRRCRFSVVTRSSLLKLDAANQWQQKLRVEMSDSSRFDVDGFDQMDSIREREEKRGFSGFLCVIKLRFGSVRLVLDLYIFRHQGSSVGVLCVGVIVFCVCKAVCIGVVTVFDEARYCPPYLF